MLFQEEVLDKDDNAEIANTCSEENAKEQVANSSVNFRNLKTALKLNL